MTRFESLLGFVFAVGTGRGGETVVCPRLRRLRRCSKRAHGYRLLIPLILALTPAVASSVPVSPGMGVSFNQIDWDYEFASEMNSQWGVMHIDTATLGGSGYINVHSSSVGWVAQNVPVDPSSGISTLTTYFDLGKPGTIPGRNLDLSVEYTPAPVSDFLTGGAVSTFALPATNQVAAAEGYGAGQAVAVGLPLPPVGAPLFGVTGVPIWQPGHPNLETANNQCAPMAVANSLQWLENTYAGFNVMHDHKMGLGPDGSLVGELEDDMARPFVNRREGTPIGADKILEGKFEYLDDTGLTGKLSTKFFDPGKDEIVGDFTMHNNTAKNQTTAGDTVSDLIVWLAGELLRGEDVEIGYFLAGGGGHFVDLTGIGFILGVPFATFVHDSDQTNDTKGLETGLTTLLDLNGDGFIDFNGKGNRLSFAISESVVSEPSSQALCVTGVMCLLLLVRRQGKAKASGTASS